MKKYILMMIALFGITAAASAQKVYIAPSKSAIAYHKSKDCSYLKNSVNNEVPQFVGIDGETNTSGLDITAGNEAQPREVAFDELSADDYNDLVVVKGVKIKRETGYWAYSDENKARIWAGNFGISTGLKSSTKLDGKLFTVTGIYSTNVLNNNLIKELNVTKAVEEYTETGIKQIANGQEPTATSTTYNMAGQRVDTSYKGLVIKNGKKHMSKLKSGF